MILNLLGLSDILTSSSQAAVGVDALTKAIKGKNIEESISIMTSKGAAKTEMEAALARQGYKDETIKAAMASHANVAAKQAETVATKKLTAEEAIEALMQENLLAQEAKELLISSGIVTAKEFEENATIKVTKAKIAEAVANGTLTATDANVIMGAFGITGANTITAASFELLTVKIWGAIKAFAKFLVTTPLGLMILATTAGIALKKLGDELNLTFEGALKNTEEHLEKFDEIKSEIDELESSTDRLKDSLKNLADKYEIELDGSETVDELVAKLNGADLSTEDKGILDNLTKQNEQYERKIALKEKLLELEQKEAAKDASATLGNKQKSVADEVEGYVPGGKRKHVDQIENVSITDAVKENVDAIEEYEQKIAELETQQLSMDAGSKEWNQAEKDINKYKDAVETLYEDTNLKEEELSTLLKSFSVDGEGLKPLEGYEKEFYSVSDALEYLNKLSLDNVIEEVEKLGEAASSVEEKLSNVDILSGVENLSTGLDQLANIYVDVKDKEDFDYSSILNNEDFNTTFGNYKEEYDNFIETITNSPKDIKACQDAFDDLATAYIHNTGVLNTLTEETKESSIQMLKQMGVANAREVVEAKLEAQTLATKLSLEDYTDAVLSAENATGNSLDTLYASASALLTEANASDVTKGALYELIAQQTIFSNSNLNVEGKISALKALATAFGVTADAAANVAHYANLESEMKAVENAYIVSGKSGEEIQAMKNKYLAQYSTSIQDKIEAKFGTIKVKGFDGGAIADKASGSGSDKDTEESFDWIQVKIERLEREISNLDKIVNATYKSWSDRNKALSSEISKVTDEIAVQEAGYKKYMDLANGVGLSDKYKNLVQSGAIDYSTIKDENLAEKIKKYQEFYELALACKDKTSELRDTLAELAKLSFENVATQYEEKLSLIEHEASVLEAYISQVEAKGHIVSKSYYEELMKNEMKNNDALRAEYTSLQSALEKAMADGSIEEGSSDWYDMMSQINGVELAIIESNTALIEFQKNIRELDWENFDRLQDMISQVTDEADFLIELMSNKDLFDEKGQVTDRGKSTFGLHAVKYNTYMEQSRDYADELLGIEMELAKDPYDIEALERKEELIQSQRDMISAAEDEKQAMIDLAEEGYNKMLEYLDELIEKRKEALQAEKDMYDYEKNVREQTEEIARLEKIGQALSGDTSEEGQLRAQQNAKSLEEAREALEETEYDKYLSDQEQMLDTLSDEAQQWVDERLSNVDQLLNDIIDGTNNNSETIKTTLETETQNVGIKLSDSMRDIWKEGGTANNVVSTYVQGVTDKVTGVITVLERIEGFVASMIKASDKKAASDINGTSNNSPTSGSSNGSSENGTSSGSSSNSNNTNSSTSDSSNKSSSKWGSWFISKKNNISKSKLNKDTSIVDRLKYLDYDSSFTARAKYYSAMGGSGTYTGSSSQNKWMISEMKKNGFHSGGLIGSAIKATGEDGFVLAKAGEYILTADQFDKLSQALVNAQPFVNAFDKLPRIDFNGTGNTITNDIEMNISMHGVQDVQGFVSELQRNDRFQKIIQQMTIGKIAGGNSLSKYKYK